MLPIVCHEPSHQKSLRTPLASVRSLHAYAVPLPSHAASLPQQVDPDVVQERYTRLVELVNEMAWEENRSLEGEAVEVAEAAMVMVARLAEAARPAVQGTRVVPVWVLRRCSWCEGRSRVSPTVRRARP